MINQPLISCAAVALLALLWIASAHAEADGPDFFRVAGVVADDVLNVRDAPDAGAAKIGEIPPDADGIRNLGCQGGLSFEEWQSASDAERLAAATTRWCRISFNGTEGWVAGRYLREGSAPAPAVAADSDRTTAWRVLTLNGGPVEGDAEMRFAPGGVFTGSTGCNRFNANGTLENGELVIAGPVAVTRMACPGEAQMAQEEAVLDLLQGHVTIEFDPFDDELRLSKESTSMTLGRDLGSASD